MRDLNDLLIVLAGLVVAAIFTWFIIWFDQKQLNK